MKLVLKTLIVMFGQSNIFVSSFTSLPKRTAFQRSLREGTTRRMGYHSSALFHSTRGSSTGNGSPNKRKRSKKSFQTGRVSTTRDTSSIRTVDRRRDRSPQLKQPHLLEPSILFSSNHIVLVNKPPGYHSQPNESPSATNSKKCMLSKLKSMELGGGSAKNFLLPMHRIDQPCSGILLLAKNSKAGTRVGNAFRKHLVQKDYFCVVSGNLHLMKQRSLRLKNTDTYKVSGVMNTKKGKHRDFKAQGGDSVVFSPIKNQANEINGRLCHLEWQHLVSIPKYDDLHLIRVKTGTGAKHQVRAMLAQLVKSPVCGDLRYGAQNPLPDRSVALHARSLKLATVTLGDTDFKNTRFIAPIPTAWKDYFSLTEQMVAKYGF